MTEKPENTNGKQSTHSETSNRLFDDFAKFMTDAAGAAQGVGRELQSAFKGQAEKVKDRMDFVQRDEFEAVKAMASRSSAQVKELRAEVDSLKKQIEGMTKAPASGKTAAKPKVVAATKSRASATAKTATKKPATKKAATGKTATKKAATDK